MRINRNLAASLANIIVGLGAFAWYKQLKKTYLKKNIDNISHTST